MMLKRKVEKVEAHVLWDGVRAVNCVPYAQSGRLRSPVNAGIKISKISNVKYKCSWIMLTMCMFVFLFLKEIHGSTGAAVTKDSGTGEMLLLDTKKTCRKEVNWWTIHYMYISLEIINKDTQKHIRLHHQEHRKSPKRDVEEERVWKKKGGFHPHSEELHVVM